jgi:hypothetical protein
MSIQSNVNQMLNTAAAGVSIIAHSPAGQKYLYDKEQKLKLQRATELQTGKIEKLYEKYDEYDNDSPEGLYLQDKIREEEQKLGEINPDAPSTANPKDSGKTALDRSLEIEYARAEEKGEAVRNAEAERKAKEEAEQADIKNIRTQEFMNKILRGTPSEYILQQQKGGTK